MVDLREAFQPFVDEPSVGPLPMTEISARARRRRLRRRSTAAGIAAAVAAVVLAVGSDDRDEGVVTSNEPSPTTSAPTTTTTTTTTTAPTTPPAPPEGLVATAGIAATEATTSSWEGGRCIEVQLENTTDAAVTWEVRTTPSGPITSMWNAVTQDQVVFTGEGWNATLAPGLTTTFGYCVEG
jgi:cellulase/cellobiase CelA1